MRRGSGKSMSAVKRAGKKALKNKSKENNRNNKSRPHYNTLTQLNNARFHHGYAS